MDGWSRIPLRAAELLSALAVVSVAADAHAFLEWSGDEDAAELRGLVRWSSLYAEPMNGLLEDRIFTDAAFVRILGELYLGETFKLEAHGLQTLEGRTGTFDLNLADNRSGETNRTRIVYWNQHQDTFSSASLELDRLNARLTLRPIDITIGRQPVSLATSSFFTPNDFFAPFFAQTFFRVYKPGVDAARIDAELGELTTATVLGVLGYEHIGEPEADDPVSLDRSSLLGRVTTEALDFGWSLLGGRVSGRTVVGGGLQGELFEWLGVRGEGHVSFNRTTAVEVALGLEHRFESTLFLRAEQFFHGAGGDDPSEYLAVALSSDFGSVPYLAKHYSAFGAGYEISALLNGDAVVLVNWADPSAMVAVYLVYSLLDEAEVSFTASLPLGEGPDGFNPNSEFGLYPFTASTELRWYF